MTDCMFPFQTQEDPRARRATELFAWCCARDDKSAYQQELKFEEEKGEFFREYLIWDAKISGVRAMAHRTTTLSKLHEEMIDCLITLARAKNWSEFFYVGPWSAQDNSVYQRFAGHVKAGAFLHALEAACEAMHSDEFYDLLLSKLNKWVGILTVAGLDVIQVEGSTYAPTTALEAQSC
jgi:hypothetical protein